MTNSPIHENLRVLCKDLANVYRALQKQRELELGAASMTALMYLIDQ